jgi:cytochrome c biogenesis protein ResB
VPAKIYASQRQRSNEKTLSKDLSSISGGQLEPEQPSQGTVIDAIAAAMVGEWMWKYVRRRKSFGVSETPQDAMGRPGTDGSVNVTGNGVRHKRWVWLSPYERAVMWSTKQPASNSALMGKSGRKRKFCYNFSII